MGRKSLSSYKFLQVSLPDMAQAFQRLAHPAGSPRPAGTKHWCKLPTREQHQPIQGTAKLCLLISYSPASFIFPSDAHWSKALKNPQISVIGSYSCIKATTLVVKIYGNAICASGFWGIKHHWYHWQWEHILGFIIKISLSGTEVFLDPTRNCIPMQFTLRCQDETNISVKPR